MDTVLFPIHSIGQDFLIPELTVGHHFCLQCFPLRDASIPNLKNVLSSILSIGHDCYLQYFQMESFFSLRQFFYCFQDFLLGRVN